MASTNSDELILNDEETGSESDDESVHLTDIFSETDSEDEGSLHDCEPTYKSILKDFTKEWIDSELNHHVSKEASNSFFELGKKWFGSLLEAKQREGVMTNIPQLVHLRRVLSDKNVPPVSLEFSYTNKTTGEVHNLEDIQSTPTSQFPPNHFVKNYEIASVKVS